jgi:hypothetical protein
MEKPPTPEIVRKCKECGARIYLVKVGKSGGTRWVTNLNRQLETWRCKYTKENPLRTHAP